MKFPSGDQYLTAVQHPETAFFDAELKSGRVDTNPLGLPKPYSGGFATAYKVKSNGRTWAVRCFKQDIPGIKERYLALGQLSQFNAGNYFVKAAYLQKGIVVSGSWYPVVKMEWVEGRLLNDFLDQHFRESPKVKEIADRFRNTVSHLHNNGIAHGDLQHGNIIIRQGNICLIDYDGVYMPNLGNLTVTEIGHVNYQHPQRDATHYGPNIDRFSSIVIYLGFLAITYNPKLWEKYNTGDNILFKAIDFSDPGTSKLLQDLKQIPDIKSHAERFENLCRTRIDSIPTLDEFLKGSQIYVPVSIQAAPIIVPRNQYYVIAATDRDELIRNVGNRVKVTGIPSDPYRGYSQYGPYLFLNFGRYPHQSCTLVFWSQILQEMSVQGIDPLAYLGQRIEITGVISLYKGVPQIEIEKATQIQLPKSSRSTQQPQQYSRQGEVSPSSTHQHGTINENLERNAAFFNTLYRDHRSTSLRNTTTPMTASTTPAKSTAASGHHVSSGGAVHSHSTVQPRSTAPTKAIPSTKPVVRDWGRLILIIIVALVVAFIVFSFTSA